MQQTTKIDITRRLAVGSVTGLIVLGVAWELWLAPVRPGGSLLALKVLPLCLPLAGLLRNRMYTYRWVSLLVWLYFIEGTVRAWSDRAPGNYLAMIEVVLCLMLFTACAMHVRVRLRDPARKAAAAGTVNTNTASAAGPASALGTRARSGQETND